MARGSNTGGALRVGLIRPTRGDVSRRPGRLRVDLGWIRCRDVQKREAVVKAGRRRAAARARLQPEVGRLYPAHVPRKPSDKLRLITSTRVRSAARTELRGRSEAGIAARTAGSPAGAVTWRSACHCHNPFLRCPILAATSSARAPPGPSPGPSKSGLGPYFTGENALSPASAGPAPRHRYRSLLARMRFLASRRRSAPAGRGGSAPSLVAWPGIVTMARGRVAVGTPRAMAWRTDERHGFSRLRGEDVPAR